MIQQCHTAIWSLHRIKNIHKYFDRDICEMLVKSLVLLHLDYSNAMLINSHDCDIDKLKQVQKVPAKMILNLLQLDSVTEVRRTLHWLPIQARIELKILPVVYEHLNNSALVYLQDLLQNNELRVLVIA